MTHELDSQKGVTSVKLEAVCRSDRSAGTLSAAGALSWLMEGQGLSQDEAEWALSGLQRTQHISVIRQPNVDLCTTLHNADLSTLQLQLVSATMPPKFGQPLNMHYSW